MIKEFTKYCIALACAMSPSAMMAHNCSEKPQDSDCQTARWGDLSNGTFANPILNADYSDPDVIRVGDKYYMTCSEFHFMGMPILESDDMVNWKIIGQVFDHIDMPGYSSMEKYGSGSWAPSLRFHDNRYWIYFCTPDEGLFMSTARQPQGPWTPLYNVKHVSGWEDPCPLWDDDGNAYLGHSRLGAGPIIIHRMSPDGTTLLDDGVTVYEGPVAEGTKLFKKDGLYYMSIPEGGVGTGWQTVLCSDNIYGPYEARRVLETGSTDVNGPHQGALVDTPDGEWWFYHFQSTGALGRVLHLQPVKWDGRFPEIGADYDSNGVGEPVAVCAKPKTGKSVNPTSPRMTDNFDNGCPGIQWQFNHNPDYSRFAPEMRDGWFAVKPLKVDRLRMARNQITQKITGYRSNATACLDYGSMHAGDRAGLECIGNRHTGLGVMVDTDNKPVLYSENNGEVTRILTLDSHSGSRLLLRLEADVEKGCFQFLYSIDGKEFVTAGEPFEMRDGDWKGCRTGLYTYTVADDDSLAGYAFFDYFKYEHDGPKQN